MGIFNRKPKDPTFGELLDRGHPKNPRTITQDQLDRLRASMARYGDLSGVVYNRRTGHVCCGHQRLKAMGEHTAIELVHQYEQPDDTGTVATGWIIDTTREATRYPYRVVKVTEPTEIEMMIAANAHGGDWNLDVLQHQLEAVKAATAGEGTKGSALERQLKAHAKKDQRPETASDATRMVHKCPACGHQWSAKP